jgi:hypothetical protein
MPDMILSFFCPFTATWSSGSFSLPLPLTETVAKSSTGGKTFALERVAVFKLCSNDDLSRLKVMGVVSDIS